MYNKDIKLGSGLIAHKYRYFYDPTHPLALSNGCVYYHRHLKSIEQGRWLKPMEQVHHIDENSLNNSLDNLQILTASEHSRLHRNAEYVTVVCLTCEKPIHTTETENKQFCSSLCASNYRVKNKSITKEILDRLIPLYSWIELGSMFGYTDNGIKKRAKALGCDITRAKYKHNKNRLESLT